VGKDEAGRLRRNVVWRRVGETVVAVEMQNGSIFELEGPAVRVWELLVDGGRTDELTATLAEEYDVDRETLERDVARTLEELTDAGLIEP
jgi:Coenzyme PQQ synthesis protein D (PqqD)